MHLLTAATVQASSDAQLIIAAVVAIAVVIVLITWLKVHPFLALIFGTATLGVVAVSGGHQDHRQLHHGRGDDRGHRRAADRAGEP